MVIWVFLFHIQLEKELLDREIELYNKQFTAEDLTITGNTVTDLQKEVYSQ